MTRLSTSLFPILRIGDEKISPEFRPLTCLTSKTFQQLKEFTQSFLAELHTGGQNGQVVLSSDILHTDPNTNKNSSHILSKKTTDAFHHQVLFLHHVRVIAINGIDVFPTTPAIHDGWNFDCGMAIF
jgi:hypothetical protein